MKVLVWYLSWDSWEWVELEGWDLSWVENLKLRVGWWGCEWVESEIVWVWEWVKSEIMRVTKCKRGEMESKDRDHRDEWERELKMRRMNWVRLVRVLLFQPKRCVLHSFFFFWISAYIGSFGQYGLIPSESAWVGVESTLHGRASSGVPRASPSQAALDAGAVAILPGPCILGNWWISLCFVNFYGHVFLFCKFEWFYGFGC